MSEAEVKLANTAGLMQPPPKKKTQKPRAERPPGRSQARPQTHGLPSSTNTGILSGPKTVHDASHAEKNTNKKRTTT